MLYCISNMPNNFKKCHAAILVKKCKLMMLTIYTLIFSKHTSQYHGCHWDNIEAECVMGIDLQLLVA